MSKGYVYILSNPSMPGILKVGKTTRDPENRAQELYQTGVPTPFRVVFSVYCPDCHGLEQAVHSDLAKFRVSAGREFFIVDPSTAERAVSFRHHEQISMMIDEFCPEHILVESEMAIDQVVICALSNQIGAHPFEVIAALEMITAEEILPAMGRWKARIALRKAAPDGDSAEDQTYD